MRSEERSGIIAIILILLWGTLVSEPFRYFAKIICDGTTVLAEKAGVDPKGKIIGLIVSVIFLLAGIALFKLSGVRSGHCIAPLLSVITLSVFLTRCLVKGEVDVKVAVALIASVVIMILFLVMRFDRGLIWLTDAYLLALPMFLLFSWIMVPLSGIWPKAEKYFFICRRSTENFEQAFKSFLGVPAIIWGIFFGLVFVLPMIYFVPGRRKG